MSRSLQDQLVEAGLAQPGQAGERKGKAQGRKAQGGKPQGRKPQGRKPQGHKPRGRKATESQRSADTDRRTPDQRPAAAAEPPASAAPSSQAGAGGAATGEAGTKSKRQIKRERMEQVAQVTSAHALSRAQGEVPYRYTRGDRIKETWVSEAERKALATGEIALVAQRGRNALIPAEHVDKVRAIDPYAVLICVDANADDEYEYGPPVPDDLIW